MILRRYMTRQVASTTALVLGFLLVLLLGGRMIRYFGIAAEGRLDVGLLFAIIGYNLPYFLELVLPLSFFIGLMLVFGRLYVDHEMAVLNSSGISRGRLARLIIPLILALFVAEAGLSLFGKPWGVRNSDNIWQQQSISSAFDLIRPKSFISSDDYHLYVGSMNEDRTELQDVILIQTADESGTTNSTVDDTIEAPVDGQTIEKEMSRVVSEDMPASAEADSEDKPLQEDEMTTIMANPMAAQQRAQNGSDDDIPRDTIVLAKRAIQVKGSEESNRTQLDLLQGRRYQVGADSLVYNQVSFERYRISIDRPPSDVITEDNVTTQTLPVLWRVATGRSLPVMNSETAEGGESAPVTPTEQEILPAQAELGYRLALPWLILIAPMLAVPLAQVRPRQGRWLRLLPAIMIFTSCALVIISLKSAVAKGTMPVWVNALAIVAFVLLALYLNWASRIRHRVRFNLEQRAQQANKGNNDETTSGGRS